jgi:hypothetical protein
VRANTLGDQNKRNATQRHSDNRHFPWAGWGISYIKRCFENHHRDKEKENPQDRASRLTARATVWMAIFTGAIFVVGLLQYLVFNRQLGVMQGQLDEMQQSFAADRAYVLSGGFSGYSGRPIAPGIEATIQFHNFGRTPADLRAVGGECAYAVEPPKFGAAAKVPGFFDESGQIPMGIIVDAGKDVGPFRYPLNATQQDIAQARSGIGKIYCRFVIVYDDMRNNAHGTNVCFWYNFGISAFLLCSEKGANYHT